jgi:selenide, water dikinase
VQIYLSTVPLPGGVRELARQGYVTGASGRNWAGYGSEIAVPADLAAEDLALFTDPQTSGGLLVTCDPASVGAVIDVFRKHGFDAAAAVGQVAPAQAGARRLVLA